MIKLKEDIIKLLRENAKYTYAQMATMLNKDAGEIESAVKELENDGIILKYSAIINNEKLCANRVEALIEVKVAPQKLNGFDSYAEEIYAFPEVQSLYLMSGGFDLAIFIEGENLNALAKFVAEKLSVIDGIVGVQTHFILKKYKIGGSVTEKETSDGKRQMLQA